MGLSSTHLDSDLCVDQRATRGTSSWGLSTAQFCTIGFCCVAIKTCARHCCRQPREFRTQESESVHFLIIEAIKRLGKRFPVIVLCALLVGV